MSVPELMIGKASRIKGSAAGGARVIALVATIPARRHFFERLLKDLMTQRRRPDAVALVLDGYGNEPAPSSPLPVIVEVRTKTPSGCGVRWRSLTVGSEPNVGLEPEDILVSVDDDYQISIAPMFLHALVGAVEEAGAAAAMGRSADGKQAPPGVRSRGDLIFGAGCGLSIRAKHLEGIRALASSVLAAGGPDALGLGGNDDALVSAYLWKAGVHLRHAPCGVIQPVSGHRATSQTQARAIRGELPDKQKAALKKITGWPWRAAPAP